jgi:hypothetical protein
MTKIDWNFVKEHRGSGRKSDYDISIYRNANYKNKKSSANYTVQFHSKCPEEIRNAETVSIGKHENSVFITTEKMGKSFNLVGDKAQVRINGKSIVDSLYNALGLPTNRERHIARINVRRTPATMPIWELIVAGTSEDDLFTD